MKFPENMVRMSQVIISKTTFQNPFKILPALNEKADVTQRSKLCLCVHIYVCNKSNHLLLLPGTMQKHSANQVWGHPHTGAVKVDLHCQPTW